MKLESELDLMGNPFTTISHSIAVEIGNLTDEAFFNSIKKWAESNGLDEVYLLDSDTMMEVFKLDRIISENVRKSAKAYV